MRGASLALACATISRSNGSLQTISDGYASMAHDVRTDRSLQFTPFAEPIHMNDILGVAHNELPLLQSTEFVWLRFRDDRQNFAFADHFDGGPSFERLVKNAVQVFTELRS